MHAGCRQRSRAASRKVSCCNLRLLCGRILLLFPLLRYPILQSEGLALACLAAGREGEGESLPAVKERERYMYIVCDKYSLGLIRAQWEHFSLDFSTLWGMLRGSKEGGDTRLFSLWGSEPSAGRTWLQRGRVGTLAMGLGFCKRCDIGSCID